MSASMGLSDAVKAYVQHWGVREHPALARCRADTAADARSMMQISPEQGALMQTLATAIRIGNPASWDLANAAIRDSHGSIDIVSDAEILAAQQWLAAQEGIFVEPASAASVAGLFKALGPNAGPSKHIAGIAEGSRIVCTVTGHGLKDPDIAREQCGNVIPAKAEKAEILRHIAG